MIRRIDGDLAAVELRTDPPVVRIRASGQVLEMPYEAWNDLTLIIRMMGEAFSDHAQIRRAK